MGMGYGANYSDVISPENLAKIAPDNWKQLTELWEEDKLTIDNGMIVLYYINNDNYELDDIEPLIVIGTPLDLKRTKRCDDYDDIFRKLCREFKANTEVDGEILSQLDLGIDYHNCDEYGDRYDDVNGAFFSVGGVYIPSPAAEQLIANRMIERYFYVTLG